MRKMRKGNSSLFSVFGGYDVCLPGMFGGGKFREKFAKPWPEVLLFKMGRGYILMGCFDTCLILF